MIGLTHSQAAMLRLIQSSLKCPTYREMGRALGYSEKNLTAPISKLLEALEAKGRIRRRYGRSRDIRVIAPLPSARLNVRLRMVFGPDHWDRVAVENRSRYLQEAA